jgi:hypothetical protein
MDYHFGWVYNPVAIDKILSKMKTPYFSQAAPHLKGTGGDKDVFYWELEEKILGKILSAWDQKDVG